MKPRAAQVTSYPRPACQGATGPCILFARVVRGRWFYLARLLAGVSPKDVFTKSVLTQVKVTVLAVCDQTTGYIVGVAR
ncbi:hypothetical protein BG454_04340 [Roseinatronobacter bogoriensis subsp. barguzinensis]|uniref:Uncharacterized protein n=1 Tax=Roseinatronobacter bogoriensis subsp. barguzinensis TaxID=441209 RepID=A0A2K8K6S4_9RHOB|nr:hypothetical protein BG454_04340 [Rhodobaca barguzinensis]